jgi:hypothetical protein
MRVKDDFISRGSFKIGNGLDTCFWEDCWLGDKPLAQQYPSLYNIVQHKDVTVANFLSGFHLNIAFVRTLTPHKWSRWIDLVQRLMDINLTPNNDKFIWILTSSGEFTVKSMYLDFLNGQTRYLRNTFGN